MPSADFCFPDDLFAGGSQDLDWVCVVVRPRWEKKFSRWLVTRKMPHFLPLIERRTVSGRKVRHSRLPLFPGYVFVLGRHARQRFYASDSVVRVLRPKSDAARLGLAQDVDAVQALLASGEPVIPRVEWTPGQRVRVLAGPLQGVVGEFVRMESHGQLIIRVNMLGTGAAVNLPPDIPLHPEGF